MELYIKLIDLLTQSREYTEVDIVLLEVYQNGTYSLLKGYCGGTDAITNIFITFLLAMFSGCAADMATFIVIGMKALKPGIKTLASDVICSTVVVIGAM